MRRSTDYFLSSHGGNLPRPAAFDAKLARFAEHEAEIAVELPKAVQWVVDKQIECGVDIVNDGEYVKAANGGNYGSYMTPRMTGSERRDGPADWNPRRGGPGERERPDSPGFYAAGLWYAGSGGPVRPGFVQPPMPGSGAAGQPPAKISACTGPVKYIGHAEVEKDIVALKTALKGKSDVDGFIAALGPFSLSAMTTNYHYKDDRDYMFALADVMREEYKAITDAGLNLQVDEPEFATTWSFHPDWSVADLRKYLDFMVEVINHAVRGLPEEQIRFHMCWGSGHRPHVQDIEFRHIVDKLLQINVQAYSFEASNPRHAHEYHVFEEVKLPDGKIIVPGVVGHYTDLVEHPDLVAERLCNFARLVGMENVHAGTDCGIGSRVGHEEIVWAKLKAMAEGCRIAGKRMKGK